MSRSLKLEDPFIDQLMELKQLAWFGRNAGGDATVMISNGLGGQAMPPDALIKYVTNIGKLDIIWAAMKDLASGLARCRPVSAEAVQKAEQGFFAKDYVDLRLKTMQSLAVR